MPTSHIYTLLRRGETEHLGAFMLTLYEEGRFTQETLWPPLGAAREPVKKALIELRRDWDTALGELEAHLREGSNHEHAEQMLGALTNKTYNGLHLCSPTWYPWARWHDTKQAIHAIAKMAKLPLPPDW
jgi:hypothetical protein